MVPKPDLIRARMHANLCHIGNQPAVLYRPDRDEHGGLLDTERPIGRVAGYPYSKAGRRTNITISLAGQLDEGDADGQYYTVLYATREDRDPGRDYDPPAVQRDDVLQLHTGARYRILAARDVFGAYHTYHLKEL